MDEWPRGMAAIELALLRRGVAARDGAHERCSGCHRTPLTGERVYLMESGPVLCELCRGSRSEPRLHSRVVRAPGYGRAIRVLAEGAA